MELYPEGKQLFSGAPNLKFINKRTLGKNHIVPGLLIPGPVIDQQISPADML
jgi:hypothetical protein